MSICILRLKNPNSHKFCHQSTHLRESRTPAVTGGRRAADLFHGSVLFVPDHSVLVLAPQRFIAVNQPLGLLLFRHSDPPIGHHALPAYGSSAIAHARLQLGNPLLRFEYATNIMSRMMEGVDLAICSAGRTVYELAHMHIPGIVLAQHEREARHTFARADHGFAYMGIMRKFNAGRLRKVFVELIDEPERRNVLYQRQSRIHFEKNKAKVVSGILKLLKKEKES